MDVFGNAHWQKSCETAERKLMHTIAQLEDERHRCESLELDIERKEQLHAELLVKGIHMSNIFTITNQSVRVRKHQHTTKLTKIHPRTHTMTNTFSQICLLFALPAQASDNELRKRIGELSSTENELREKVHASETEFGERLRAASMRERELNDKLNALNRQLAAINREAEQKDRQWQEKYALCSDELVVMRARNSPAVTTTVAVTTSATAATSSTATTNSMQSTPTHSSSLHHQHSNGSGGKLSGMLQDEVESLRCVLELKQNEISELRKKNHELVADAEALPGVTLKVNSLEKRLEDLQLQLKQKCAEER